MTPEEVANMVLQKRGFLVIGSTSGCVKKRGDILPSVGSGPTERLNHPVVVIAESNAEEWQQQRALLGLEPESTPEGSRFYRVVAE